MSSRREFITLLGGAAAAWPLAARAQQPAMPVIGFLSARSPAESAYLVAGFREGLKQSGYVEGQNVAIEYRSSDGQHDRLPALAAELVGHRVAVIATTGGTPAARAAKAATATIPIVFTTGGDPVKLGLVASMNRPGGNATGISVLTTTLEAKRLELLREVIPSAGIIALLVNPSNADAQAQSNDIQAAARSIGQEIVIVYASHDGDLEPALAKVVEQKAGALIVGNDSFFITRREQLVKLVSQLPSSHDLRLSRVRRRRRFYELRDQPHRYHASVRPLYSADSQGRKSGQSAGHAADQIRADHQPQDCQVARPRRATDRCSPAPTR